MQRQVTLLEQEYETDDIFLSLAGRKAELPRKFGIDSVADHLLQQELILNINVCLGLTSPQEQRATLEQLGAVDPDDSKAIRRPQCKLQVAVEIRNWPADLVAEVRSAGEALQAMEQTG